MFLLGDFILEDGKIMDIEIYFWLPSWCCSYHMVLNCSSLGGCFASLSLRIIKIPTWLCIRLHVRLLTFRNILS
jgi:hypothetical protein